MKKLIYIFNFFKRKVLNNLETNTSGTILPTTNVEKNLDVPIKENLDIIIEENSALLTPSPNSILENNHN